MDSRSPLVGVRGSLKGRFKGNGNLLGGSKDGGLEWIRVEKERTQLC